MLDNRPALVRAALTILRAYIVAGKPDCGLKPFGGFERWSELVRSALVWLEEPDPCDTREELIRADPIREDLGAMLDGWHATFGTVYKTASDVVTWARGIDDQIKSGFAPTSETAAPFLEALQGIAADRRGTISSRRLGKWLSRHKNRPLDGKCFQMGETRMGVALWRCVALSQ